MDMEKFMPLFYDGMVVTLVGMFVVMVFLTVMIWVIDFTQVIVRYINKKFPVEVKDETAKKSKQQTNDTEDIAVAIAAVLSYQSKA